ncbi:MAG: cell division protein ZapE [Woeseiaceae bacterium]
MMTPIQRYQYDIQQRKIKTDDKQWQAVQCTQRVYSEYCLEQNSAKGMLRFFKKKKIIKGLYLWGGTGRGKTFLVDCFYECLPGKRKHRIHFHRFMLDIHEQLDALPKSPNPLNIIAAKLAEKIDVLCLDEFHVHDIADAMLMVGLLKAIFKEGIILVVTSNIEIQGLYKNGLQRERFMSAIDLLTEFTEEFDLGDDTDYRFKILDENSHFYVLDSEHTSEAGNDFLSYKLLELAPCPAKTNRSIEVNHRQINYLSLADDVIWFEFHELCETNRSAYDYIQIAEEFHSVLVSHIPTFTESDDAAAKRFIHFIDAIYDHNVKLIATSIAVPSDLYLGSRLKFAFERTVSRLTEMGTEHYLQLAHNPTGTIRKVDA